MASKPKHQLWEAVMQQEVTTWSNKSVSRTNVLDTTGPGLLTNVLSSWKPAAQSVEVLSADVMYPEVVSAACWGARGALVTVLLGEVEHGIDGGVCRVQAM